MTTMSESLPDHIPPPTLNRVPLSNVCEFIRGVSFDKVDVRTSPAADHLPILRAGNIQNTLNTKNDLIWVPSRNVSAVQRLQVGDIAICMSSGSASVVGKTAALTSPFPGSVGAFCGIIRVRSLASADFVAQWFRSDDYIRWRDSQARGANIQNLRFSQLTELMIPLPPLPEQQRIAAILTEKMAVVDVARAAAEAQLDAIKQLPAAYLRVAFSGATDEGLTEGEDVVRRRNSPLRGVTSSDGSAVPGGRVPALPDGWRWVRLDVICNAVRGVTFPSDEATSTPSDDTIACLTTSAVQTEVAWATRRYIPARRITHRGQLLQAGDLLVSTANSKSLVGKSCLVGKPPFLSTFGAFVTVLRPKPDVLPEILACWMRTAPALGYCYEKSSNTTNISNLRVSDLMNMKMPLPPLSEQQRIATLLTQQTEAVNTVRAASEAQLTTIKQLPAALLREAFAGRV